MSSISGTWVSTGALEELGQGRPKGSTAMAKGLGQQFATLFSLRPQNGPKKFPRPQLDPEWMFATPRDPKIFFNKTGTAWKRRNLA